MKRLFLSLVIFCSIIFPANVSALSIDDLSKKFDRSEEIQTYESIVDNKKSTLDSINLKINEYKNKRDDLSNTIADLKASVDSIDSRFVHINKYAPDSSGNKYAPLNCTWYVKSMRPDISNFWGNANSWYKNAEIQGWNVGSEPKKGAVATTTEGYYGHVAYVIGVSLDGNSVTIREMNYGFLGNMNTRTVPSSDFKYIYELD